MLGFLRRKNGWITVTRSLLIRGNWWSRSSQWQLCYSYSWRRYKRIDYELNALYHHGIHATKACYAFDMSTRGDYLRAVERNWKPELVSRDAEAVDFSAASTASPRLTASASASLLVRWRGWVDDSVKVECGSMSLIMGPKLIGMQCHPLLLLSPLPPPLPFLLPKCWSVFICMKLAYPQH